MSLPVHVWAVALHSLLTNLHMSLSSALYATRPLAPSAGLKHRIGVEDARGPRPQAVFETALTHVYIRNSVIVYEVFVAHFRELRCTSDFQTVWLRFM